MKIQKNVLTGVVLHIAAWLCACALILYIFQHSTSKYVYAVISGWWCALYVGYIFKIGFGSCAIAFMFYLCYEIVVIIVFGSEWLYHDISGGLDFSLFLRIVSRDIIFISPVFANAAVQYAKHKISAVRS
jgi:hypothetical protein